MWTESLSLQFITLGIYSKSTLRQSTQVCLIMSMYNNVSILKQNDIFYHPNRQQGNSNFTISNR